MKRLALALIALACLYSTNVEARGHRGLPWCGIYMGKYFGMSDRSLWIARNWAHVGSSAGGPGQGVVVVWPHHVGVITGQTANGEWIVHSGNDGGAVRTRPRSLRGVIAFRHVGGASLAYNDLKVQEQAVRGRHKHLVALAVEGWQGNPSLKQPRARTRIAAGEITSAYASPFAAPAQTTNEIWPQQRKPMSKRKRVLVALNAPMPDTVHAWHSESFGLGSISQGAPRTGYVRQAAYHPSSQASQQWGWNSQPGMGSLDMFAHAPAGGAAAVKHAYPHRAR
jgi:hypothetical protein